MAMCNVLPGAKETLYSKLDVVQEFYERAAKPFQEVISALKEYEEKEMDPLEGASPYDEIKKNQDFLNLLGQSCLCLMSTVVNDYLQDFAKEKGHPYRPSLLSFCKRRYLKIETFFKEELGINLKELKNINGLRFDLVLIREIIDVRNSIQHENRFWDLSCWHPESFYKEFPQSRFSGERIQTPIVEGGADTGKAMTSEISVTPEGLKDAKARIEAFSKCLEVAWSATPSAMR
jgi:hypothetical protein